MGSGLHPESREPVASSLGAEAGDQCPISEAVRRRSGFTPVQSPFWQSFRSDKPHPHRDGTCSAEDANSHVSLTQKHPFRHAQKVFN